MIGYVIRRLFQGAVVAILVSIVVFLLLHALPGGLVRSQLGPKATHFAVHQLTIEEGLNKPLVTQYGIWLNHLVHGNLGFSYKLNTPVSTLIGEYLPRDLVLEGIALVLSVLSAIPLGMIQGARRNKGLDYGVSGTLLTVYAMPLFLLGVILIFALNIWLHVLPSTAQAFGASIGTDISVLALPVITLALGNLAYFSRYVRSSVIDNLLEDYVRTAKAKGSGSPRILFRHVLRNSLLPFVSVVGISLPTLVSGALVVEVLFDYPGMGLLFWDAQTSRTFPVLLGIVLLVSILVVVGNLLADLAYAALDPRIRYV